MDGRGASREQAPAVELCQTLPLDGPLCLLLLRYLQTDGEPGAIGFRLARSADVDALLCRLVLDAEDVRAELGAVLARLVEGAALEPGELPAAWYGHTAAAIHHLDTLEERLRAYVGAHWKEACARFGFTDYEATEPPDESRPATAPATQPARRACATPAPAWVQRRSSRSYFERRLGEEVCRSVRGLGGFSLIAFEVVAAADGGAGRRELPAELVRLIRGGLRPYDVCARIDTARVAVLLPGAASGCCAAVVARVRRAFAEALDGARLAIGAASWPEHGLNVGALLGALDAAVARDRRRLERGEVDFDSIPSFMVDDAAGERPERRGRLWLEGVGEGLSAEVAPTPAGLRLRAPLGFLRAGMTVRLGEQGRVLRGRVRGAFLAPSSPGQAPVLQLDIEPASR